MCTAMNTLQPMRWNDWHKASGECCACLSRGVVDAGQEGVLKGDSPPCHLQELLAVLQERIQRVRLCTAPAQCLSTSSLPGPIDG